MSNKSKKAKNAEVKESTILCSVKKVNGGIRVGFADFTVAEVLSAKVLTSKKDASWEGVLVGLSSKISAVISAEELSYCAEKGQLPIVDGQVQIPEGTHMARIDGETIVS
jgi:hypothetical protein